MKVAIWIILLLNKSLKRATYECKFFFKGQYIRQMINIIQQLLQHGYTTTVVLYPFKENLSVLDGHIMSAGGEPKKNKSFITTCIISDNGDSIEEQFFESWDRSKNVVLHSNKEEEGKGLLVVNCYMTELYRLSQKGKERNEYEEKIRLLLEKSFSKVLRQTIIEEKGSHNNLNIEVEENKHYVVVVPTEWSDKAAKDILNPIFIKAGLITKDNPSSRLIFVDKLHAIIYSFQKFLSDPNNKYWLEYGTLKKNKHYAVFEADFEYLSGEASINCFLFQTGNANSMINGMEGVKPYNVAKFGEVNLVSISDIKKNLLKLLNKSGVISLSLSEFLIATTSEKKSYDRTVNKFLDKVIEITIAYYMNNKRSENDLVNKGHISSTSQMSSQYPFRKLDFLNYSVNLTKLQSSALEEISMEQLYEIFFWDNELRIKNYIEECLRQYSTTLQGAILVERDSNKAAVYHSIDNLYEDSRSGEWNKYIRYADHKSDKKVTVRPKYDDHTPGDMNNCYIKSVSHIISSCTEAYFSSTSTNMIEKLRYFKYSDIVLAGDLLLKIKDDVKNSLNFLPPSIIQYPESKYASITKSTERSHPRHIVDIDLSLSSCRYSYVQIEKYETDKAEVNNDKEIEGLSIPPLNSFISIESTEGDHTNANLHVSQEMLNLIESTHLQPALEFFAKYDRKAIRSSNLNDYNKSSSASLDNDQQALDEEFDDKFIEEDIDSTTKSSLPDKLFSTIDTTVLLPVLKKLFEYRDTISKENLIVVAHRPSYVVTFMVAYLYYLKHVMSAYLKQKHSRTVSDEVFYVVSVEKLLLDKCLMGSKSALKELLLASGMTNISMIRKQIRVMVQGEFSFPMLQKKANLVLPLKSYYVHAQLYENSIQMSLSQVVVKGNTDSTPMTIVIKNSTIPIKHIHELLCNSLWDQIQSNSHQSLCKEHQVDRSENFEEREYTVTDRLDFEKTFMQYVKELSSLNESIESKGLKIPNDGSFCDCSTYLTHNDIMELSIKPVLKTLVSSILGTLNNDQVFGRYNIAALFVAFDSILNSVFHYSYKKVLKLILKDTLKIRLEAKQLGIPYFVLLPESYSHRSVKARESTLGEIFTKGSLLQVSSATYMLGFRSYTNAGYSFIKPKVYSKDLISLKLKQATEDDTMIKILERGDTLPKEKGVIKKTIYFRLLGESQRIYVDLFRCDRKMFKKNSGDDNEFNQNRADSVLTFIFSFRKLLDSCNHKLGLNYEPLYITIKPLGYQSLVSISFQFGGESGYRRYNPHVIRIGDRLTLKNTQYSAPAEEGDSAEN